MHLIGIVCADAPRRQIFSHVLVLNKLRCCGLLFEVASSVASSSCIRVVFPRRGREAPFSFAVCLLTRFHSCKPILVDLWLDSRSALPVSIDTKVGRDQPFCFPCVWRCLRPVVLLLCVSCLRLSVLMHGPGLAAAFGVLAAAPCAAGSSQAASRQVPGWWRVGGSAGQARVQACACAGRPGRAPIWPVPILKTSPIRPRWTMLLAVAGGWVRPRQAPKPAAN